jgi:hypothetical protein
VVELKKVKIVLILLVCTTCLRAQVKEMDSGELKMTFPSIYFKHNSTDYATMPYTVDSCFKYIAFHFKDNINSLVIWRDSAETEELTYKRIKKLKIGLNKYKPSGKIEIYSMGKEQKISRHTINMSLNPTEIQYLLTLNSVFDFSKTRFPNRKKDHRMRPRWWCILCWKAKSGGLHKFIPGK